MPLLSSSLLNAYFNKISIEPEVSTLNLQGLSYRLLSAIPFNRID